MLNNSLIKTKIQYILYLVLYSISISVFVLIFYNKIFVNDYFILFFTIIAFYIFSILSWFYNIRNYSNLSSIKYLLISIFTAVIYILVLILLVKMNFNIFILPLLYPLISAIVQKSSKFVLLR